MIWKIESLLWLGIFGRLVIRKRVVFTLQNMGGLIKHGLLPEKTPEQILGSKSL